MARALASVALRLLCGVAAAWALWRFMGAVGLVVSAPLFGVLLARPLLDLLSGLRHSARRLAYAPVEGRHFEHRGIALDIAEDERHHRWISLQDLRKLIPSLPRDAVLQARFAQRLRADPDLRGPRIEAEALVDYLAQATGAESLRLRNWLEREVVRPAARVRQRLGIRDEIGPHDSEADPRDSG